MLAQQGADLPTVMTGLLHDTVEDTGATLQQITGRFGPEVSAASPSLSFWGDKAFAQGMKQSPVLYHTLL
jgi:GTP pyrophosphokinase